jgi:hypothetical protein
MLSGFEMLEVQVLVIIIGGESTKKIRGRTT